MPLLLLFPAGKHSRKRKEQAFKASPENFSQVFSRIFYHLPDRSLPTAFTMPGCCLTLWIRCSSACFTTSMLQPPKIKALSRFLFPHDCEAFSYSQQAFLLCRTMVQTHPFYRMYQQWVMKVLPTIWGLNCVSFWNFCVFTMPSIFSWELWLNYFTFIKHEMQTVTDYLYYCEEHCHRAAVHKNRNRICW